ncbi:hypothetical protein HK101_000330 [Irineochytrium annulatum]|nr:hypothetical protein HK101_000330 [Irineochytrium annulatum]
MRTGANLTLPLVFYVRKLITTERDRTPEHVPMGVVILAGTDTMDEFAFTLSLLGGLDLPAPTGARLVATVLTGAMRPSDAIDFDGPLNVRDAIRVLRDLLVHRVPPISKPAPVVVVMGSRIHRGDEVWKTHTRDLEESFTSVGSGGWEGSGVGRLDRGQVVWMRDAYWSAASWENTPWMCMEFEGRKIDCRTEFSLLRWEDFKRRRVVCLGLGMGMEQDAVEADKEDRAWLENEDKRLRTAAPPSTTLWTYPRSESAVPKSVINNVSQQRTFDPSLQVVRAMVDQVDAIVLSLPGAGSLSISTRAYLRQFTKRVGIVLTARSWGPNFDDDLYKGSTYEKDGFEVREYDGLNAYRARIVKLFKMAVEDKINRLTRAKL